MTNLLQQYFPMIRTREEILKEIHEKGHLQRIFYEWQEEQQEEFLNFCTGVKGVKMMYDFMIKEILDPSAVPDRVNELLSLILGQKVKIIDVLPNDGTRIADEFSLLIMDMVVQLEDGSIVDLEIQKIGYMFPGERSACYSADLLLRQYRRVRNELKKANKKFSYKNIKPVYTIILFETSPALFHKFPEEYMHSFEQKSDTGVEMNLLQKYIFIPLDIFKSIQHNKDDMMKIENRLEAWLAFLCMDEPENIIAIIEKYPDFKDMYEQVYDVCQNLEEVMGMFSKELLELDRNTVQLMIDEMAKELENLKTENQEKEQTILVQSKKLTEKDQTISAKNEELTEKNQRIIELLKKVEELEKNVKA